MELLLLQK